MKTCFYRSFVFFVISICVICTALTGCSADISADPFCDFSGDISVQCTADVQGATSRILFSRIAGEIKTEFQEPKSLAGITLRKKDGSFSIGYGDFYADISESAALMLNLCDEVFSPHYSEMTVIRSEERDGEKLTVIESGGYIYRFSKEDSPLSISGIFEGKQFEIVIASISSLTAENGGSKK